MSTTTSAEAVVKYLNKVKPYDGWSIDIKISDGKRLMMLRRRNVPLSHLRFEDIIYDNMSGCVLGFRSISSETAIILVEKDGSIPRTTKIITAKHNNIKSSNKKLSKLPETNTTTIRTTVSDDQNKLFLQFGCAAIVAAIMINIFYEVLQVFFISFGLIVVPFFITASLTCPDITTFDTMKELKRVFRGDHLSDNDPNKPKGWLSETAARFTATLTANLASGLGYEVSHTSFMGFAILTRVKLEATNIECYWIGIFNKWYFITQRKVGVN